MTVAVEVSSVLSRLALIPLRDLVQHEDVEPSRLDAIADALSRSGTLKNPILVTRLAGDKWLIIDGAHRARALGHAGAELALTQVFEPDECILSAWHHWLPEPAARVPADDLLTEQCPGCHGLDASSGGRCLATVHRRERVGHAWCDTADIGAAVRMTHELASRYAAVSPCWRMVPDGQREPVSCADSVRIAYRPWSIGQLCRIAILGLTLPPGVTRFVAPGRILGLDVPLSLMLTTGSPATSPDAVLRYVRRRQFRYYAEPVFLAE